MFFGKKEPEKDYSERKIKEIESSIKELDEQRMSFYTWGILNVSGDQTSDETIIEAGIKATQYIQPFYSFDNDERDELPGDIFGVTMNRELGLLCMQVVELNIIMKMKEEQRDLAILKTFLFNNGYTADLREVIHCGRTIEDYWRTIDWIRDERRAHIRKIKDYVKAAQANA